jgi:hypothetical protein
MEVILINKRLKEIKRTKTKYITNIIKPGKAHKV